MLTPSWKSISGLGLLSIAFATSCSLLLDVEECDLDADCARFASTGETWQCGAGNTCTLTSTAECIAPSDCEEGETCTDGTCVSIPTNNPTNNMVDMGADDGVVDMGMDMEEDMDVDPYVRIGCDTPPCKIRQSQEWTADNVYLLEDTMYVESGVTLTIARGTRIEGATGSALIIKRGAQIQARGTVNEPIVFTSAAPVGQRLPGDWGGVAVLGSAPINEPNAELEGIADIGEGLYGGNLPDSSCGALEYVRIEFGGFPLSLNKELNGLTLGGCGAGTIVNHVQIHKGSDDGLEIFGGTVSVKNILITQAQDDGLDWDRGWTGNAQFIAIQQDNSGDNGFESDNWSDSADATPRSAPKVYNYTIIGSKQGAGTGMTLKAGTAGEISHGIVMGSQVAAIDIKGAEAATQATSDALSVRRTFFFDIGVGGSAFWQDESEAADDDDGGFDEAAHFAMAQYNNRFQDPNLPNAFSLDNPQLVPPVNSPVADVGNVSPDDFFDQSARFAGAFKPGAAPWTDGWTAFPAN